MPRSLAREPGPTALAVVRMREGGKTACETAAALGISPKVAYRYLHRWAPHLVRKQANNPGKPALGQMRVYRYVWGYMEENGHAPCVREVMQAQGFASTNAVADVYAALERIGYIKWVRGIARGVVPLVNPNAEDTDQCGTKREGDSKTSASTRTRRAEKTI